MMTARYDQIGDGYARHRRPDPRFAAAMADALGDAERVLNVGAGTGSYEPADRQVLAVEPSSTMISQRPSGSAPVIQAVAERLPLASGSQDAALAVLSVHHWTDWRAGLRELCRVAPTRVIWTFDASVHNRFWAIRDYFPRAAFVGGLIDAPPIDEIARAVEATRIETTLVPHDCIDLFGVASWRHPERFLDDSICAATSMLAQLPIADLRRGQARLAEDLRSGRWHDRHADLLDREELDCGLRLVIAA